MKSFARAILISVPFSTPAWAAQDHEHDGPGNNYMAMMNHNYMQEMRAHMQQMHGNMEQIQ